MAKHGFEIWHGCGSQNKSADYLSISLDELDFIDDDEKSRIKYILKRRTIQEVQSQHSVRIIAPVDLEEILKDIKEYIDDGNATGTPIWLRNQAESYVAINRQLMSRCYFRVRQVREASTTSKFSSCLILFRWILLVAFHKKRKSNFLIVATEHLTSWVLATAVYLANRERGKVVF